MSDNLSVLLSQLALSLPNFAVYLAGLAFAFVKLRHSHRARTFVALGCGILLANASFGVIVFPMLMNSAERSGSAPPDVWWWTAVGVASALLHCLGLALVVAAVFADRNDGGEN